MSESESVSQKGRVSEISESSIVSECKGACQNQKVSEPESVRNF